MYIDDFVITTYTFVPYYLINPHIYENQIIYYIPFFVADPYVSLFAGQYKKLQKDP